MIVLIALVASILWHAEILFPYSTPRTVTEAEENELHTERLEGSVEEEEDEEDQLDSWCGAAISFDTRTLSSNMRDWQAALSLHQINQDSLEHSLEEYRFPCTVG